MTIMHEDNKEQAFTCEKCETSTDIYALMATTHIRGVRWFILRCRCGNCHNTWGVWDCEYPIGGDPIYNIPYTWVQEVHAG